MQKSRCTDSQIMAVLKRSDGGEQADWVEIWLGGGCAGAAWGVDGGGLD